MMNLYVGGMPSREIGVWRVSPQSLKARKIQSVDGLFSPSFLCVHPKLPVLYAAERSGSADDSASGSLSTFEILPGKGMLRQVHRCPSGGAFTAHVSVSADGWALAAANPRGPTVAVFRLDARGIPQEPPRLVRHSGRGATERQALPWPHSAYFDPSGRRLFACDLALDRVFIYDLESGPEIVPDASQPSVQVSSGAGARHLSLSRDGRCLYVANELDSSISVFRRDAQASPWRIVQTLGTVPERSLAGNQPAEIVTDASGRSLFVTNRGHDSIGLFKISAATGRLRSRGWVSAQGRNPRHLCIAPGGAVAAVCNQGSNEVALFRVSKEGRLRAAGRTVRVSNPTCAVIVDTAVVTAQA